MCLKLSSSTQEGNLLLLLVKIRFFFTLIGSAKIYEFLCILRELCKGCTCCLYPTLQVQKLGYMLYKLSKYFFSNILWIEYP